MVKRLKLGIIFRNHKNWTGGNYYQLNFIQALNSLADAEKPELLIVSYSRDDFELVKSLSYPYLVSHVIKKGEDVLAHRLHERIINKATRAITGRNLILRNIPVKRLPVMADILFMADNNPYFSSIGNRVCFIPDFQHVSLPEYFSTEEIQIRNSYYESLAKLSLPIILSSEDALNQFKQLYPWSKSPLFVLNFAVSHPSYQQLDSGAIRAKYGLTGNYFISPNQFWKHKNHKLVIEAIKLLKEQGLTDLRLAFTGMESNFRYPDYPNELKKLVSDYGLESQVLFLGFVDRAEQLLLMKQAIAVIQPSLFEGWSTVVEDAKALNQFILASDIKVHREQDIGNMEFFDPHSSSQLARLLRKYNFESPPIKSINYSLEVRKFGNGIMKITSELTGT